MSEFAAWAELALYVVLGVVVLFLVSAAFGSFMGFGEFHDRSR